MKSCAEMFKRDKSKYLRLLIDWIEPVAPPSVEVKEFTRELRHLGVSMNQIAARANTLGFVDDLEYRRYADEVLPRNFDYVSVFIALLFLVIAVVMIVQSVR